MLQEMRECGVEPRLLTRAVPRPQNTSYVVPNVIHYIRYTNNVTFEFQHYLSYRSVQLFIRPRYIFLHGDSIPDGEWWQKTLAEVDNLYHVYRKQPKDVHGTPIQFIQHSADITRLVVLIDYGGIYIDDDVLIIRSFDPLRNYDLTLGRPVKIALSNGIIIARKGALFLRIWLENYRNYNPKSWGGNSVAKGSTLGKLFPHLVHVEEQSLLHPSWQESPLMFSHRRHYNWTENYCIHIYFENHHKIPKIPEQLKSYDNTLGQVMRHIYYGNSSLIPVPGPPFRP
ncbi:hypothetical protein NP493_119g01005 [Ridgeia piscesae]|uniref:Alpha-1,4-N-acetylglucosaminyltransferase n=1 Tax=Ridgeia piscesae TaxID=27915 RepID=A0AAD9UH30_RIDPI|nr:hypothetical protein NP493_119g01005 [Ridgeia piscesae]